MTHQKEIDAIVRRIEKHWPSSMPPGWRPFIRICTISLFDRLPDEAKGWLQASDAYDRGEIDEMRLEEVRVLAWKYNDEQRSTETKSNLSALRVAMYGLWPSKLGNDWPEALGYFIEYCVEAKIGEIFLLKYLKEYFSEALPENTP